MELNSVSERKYHFSAIVGLTLLCSSTVLLSRYRGQQAELQADNVVIWMIPFIAGIASLLFSMSSREWRRASIRAALGGAFSVLIALLEPTAFGRIAIAFVYVVGCASIAYEHRRHVGANRDIRV